MRAVDHTPDPIAIIPTVTLISTPCGLAALVSRLRQSSAIGGDPRRLATYLQTVLEGVPDELGILDGIIPADQRAAFDAACELVRPFLREMVRLASRIDPVILGREGEASDRHPWAADVDHVASVAFQEIGETGERDAFATADSVSKALRLIAGLRPVAKDIPRRGRPPAHGLAGRVVRAVCLYLYEQGISIEHVWSSDRVPGAGRGSRRTDEELVPVSQAAVLIVDAARALGSNLDHASLANAHKAYLTLLQAEERAPCGADILHIGRVEVGG